MSRGRGLRRRTLFTAGAGAAAAAALPAGPARADAPDAAGAPENWPDPQPYGRADVRPDLWPRSDNSFVLPLELRPRDEELGRVWIRDTYVNCFIENGRPVYVATGTTRVAGLDVAAPHNDGIFVWVAPALEGPWRLADTTAVRPDAEKGKVWSPEFAAENRPGRTVVAPWQEYWHDAEFGKRGQAWAPEIHLFRGTWYIVACMGDHSRKVGSFLLVSEGGAEGPYRLAEGNRDKPFGDPFEGGPDFIAPGAYHPIDGGLYTEDGRAWLVLHNDFFARFGDDMEDIVPATGLPRFEQVPYDPEPYLEGAYVHKHRGRYYLMHAAWNRAAGPDGDGPPYAYLPSGSGREQYHYDTVAAVSDRFEGPYSPRWTLGVGIGHDNVFEDHRGQLWATFFRNPVAGYWSDPARVGDAAAAGVVRLEWTGPHGNRLYVRRRAEGGGTAG
ncbi:family 43 glycosylhydrolase [Nocardiopsis coralliicola]